MAKEGYSKLALILSLIAAALAFSAAAIEYSRQGEVKLGLIAGGLFLLAFGFRAKTGSNGERELDNNGNSATSAFLVLSVRPPLGVRRTQGTEVTTPNVSKTRRTQSRLRA